VGGCRRIAAGLHNLLLLLLLVHDLWLLLLVVVMAHDHCLMLLLLLCLMMGLEQMTTATATVWGIPQAAPSSVLVLVLVVVMHMLHLLLLLLLAGLLHRRSPVPMPSWGCLWARRRHELPLRREASARRWSAHPLRYRYSVSFWLERLALKKTARHLLEKKIDCWN
jgi:hypothetical protein